MPSADYIKALQAYHITVTDADTEYTLELPEDTKYLRVQTQDASAFRFAFESGKVASPTAPYISIPASGVLELSGLLLHKDTLYVACPAGAKTVEVLAGS